MKSILSSGIFRHAKKYAREYICLLGVIVSTVNLMQPASLRMGTLLACVLFTVFATWAVFAKRIITATILGVVAIFSFFSAAIYLGKEQLLGLSVNACIGMGFAYLIRHLLQTRDNYKAKSLVLEHIAYHDMLTGLPNRRLFDDRLHQAILHAKRNGQLLAILFLDLDKFKVVNDTLGHASGDTLIRCTGERLLSCLREGDTVYRQGGDEFTVLLEYIAKPEDVRIVVTRIQSALEQPFILDGNTIYVTASIGIAIYPNDGESMDQLMMHADTAMYGAKERGNNNYQFFAPEMDALIAGKVELETALRQALGRGEMEIHYQPQYHLTSKSLVGMEAIICWRRPEMGILLSREWQWIAEETGLIISIEEWALLDACKQVKSWQNQGFASAKLSMGISLTHFKRASLVERISAILEESGLDPKQIELDLADGVSSLSVHEVTDKLQQLKRIGIGIAMDDLCAGLLSNLKRLPIDTLILDSTLIRDLAKDHENEALAVAIIAMAERLQVNLIAKGVETQEQLELLQKLNCKEAQGHHLSNPLTASEFQDLFVVPIH
jgi:diguanylate cyclase (GGDEF)-like protein